jgi:GDPmannose 4,6-dehydratase
MWRMLQQPAPDDFVVATGMSHSLEHFVDLAFREAGLQWRDHVAIDETLYRPTDLDYGRADPGKAAKALGWRARHGLEEVVRMMVSAERGGNRPA